MDPAVLFKEERGLARGYLAGPGGYGDRFSCLGVSEYCGNWVSSEASSVDLVVLLKEGRGLARGYLTGLGGFGDGLHCLGVPESGRRVSMCCFWMGAPLAIYVQCAARVSINAFTTSPSVSFPLWNRDTQTARSCESFASNHASWDSFGTDPIARAARK